MNMKLLLMCILMLFAPSIYFIGVAAGVLPAIFYFYFVIGDRSTLVIWGIHLVIYAVLYFAVAHVFINFLSRVVGKRWAAGIASAAMILIVAVSLFPIYVLGGHNSSVSVNIVEIYKRAGMLSKVPWQ